MSLQSAASRGPNGGVRVLVGVKRVYDPKGMKVRLNRARTAVDPNMKACMNPFDQVALEEAVQLRERGWASQVLAVSVGSRKCIETLRTAMALGCDKGILVDAPDGLEPLNVAKILHQLAIKEGVTLALLGCSAADTDDSQTAPMLAELAGWQQATFAAKLEVIDRKTGSKFDLKVKRAADAGTETIFVSLPAVVSCHVRLNTPRAVRLQDVVRANSKPVETLTPAALGVPLQQHWAQLRITEASRSKHPVQMCDSAATLIDKLKADGVLP
eukprot:TRINITY_DN17364_c0_g1_i1.p1 TRINITY_DN17364_c0_g1~~TRINITY_DN17364_c0_g1_i1.p1  ORF type:complete len:271 (+),score=93.27 TRINITY_DN17364_c0_g1_i1:15-827(+)